jgi:glycosyltransferase involved in cell wall biosynthesis
VAFLCLPGLESFLGDIVTQFSQLGPVRTCYSTEPDDLQAALEWAEVVWIEWANELAVTLTGHPTLLDGKRVICRLHSYEAFAPHVEQIKWEKINDLIFVAPHIKDHACKAVPDLSERVRDIYVIPNGIDLGKYRFVERKPGRNLAFLGFINYKKGPQLLLHAFAELIRRDPDYRLHIAGQYQDDRYRLYLKQMLPELELEGKVSFDGWIDDVESWLADKNYVVCSSVLESQGMGIMQAMAMGIKPVIHSFVGASEIYDGEFLWTRISEFADQVQSSEYDSQRYREFVESRYSLEKTNAELSKVLLPKERIANG